MATPEINQPVSVKDYPAIIKLMGAMGTGMLIGGTQGPDGALVGGAIGGTVYILERLMMKGLKIAEKLADDYTNTIENL
jgi:multisubunit Na+/H+ antiporter MnhB subunit